MASLRGAHDDAATPALGHVIRQQGTLEVVKAEAALGAVVPPVAVVVAETSRATRFVTDLRGEIW